MHLMPLISDWTLTNDDGIKKYGVILKFQWIDKKNSYILLYLNY